MSSVEIIDLRYEDYSCRGNAVDYLIEALRGFEKGNSVKILADRGDLPLRILKYIVRLRGFKILESREEGGVSYVLAVKE